MGAAGTFRLSPGLSKYMSYRMLKRFAQAAAGANGKLTWRIPHPESGFIAMR